MTVSAGKKIGIEYTLTHEGSVLDSNVGKEPLEYTHGQQQIVPGLEKALDGMSQGEEKQVQVAPNEAYGEINSEAIIEIPKQQVPQEAHKPGTQLMTKDPQGNTLRPFVREVKDETIVLDFNHPLAGKTLTFDVKIVSIDG